MKESGVSGGAAAAAASRGGDVGLRLCLLFPFFPSAPCQVTVPLYTDPVILSLSTWSLVA